MIGAMASVGCYERDVALSEGGLSYHSGLFVGRTLVGRLRREMGLDVSHFKFWDLP
jgi:hypothetical protein